MKVDSLQELLLEELGDLYDAEQQITKALPKMSKAASTPELKQAFDEHLRVTRRQVERLERVFKELGAEPAAKPCKGMKALLAESKEIMKQTGDGTTIDAGLIAAAQKVEHYEIAGYGTVRTHADTIGKREAARLLQETLDEEKEADLKLSKIAEAGVNTGAVE